MHQALPPLAEQAGTGLHSPAPHADTAAGSTGVRHPEKHVSDNSDRLREVAILRAGHEIEAAMARYAASSCLTDRADADAARLRMEALIRGRSAAQVERMQAAQARRMELEPGAPIA